MTRFCKFRQPVLCPPLICNPSDPNSLPGSTHLNAHAHRLLLPLDYPPSCTACPRPIKASISPLTCLCNMLNEENHYGNGKFSVSCLWKEKHVVEKARWWVARARAWLATLCTERFSTLVKGQNICATTIICDFPFKKTFSQAVLTVPQLFSTPN